MFVSALKKELLQRNPHATQHDADNFGTLLERCKRTEVTKSVKEFFFALDCCLLTGKVMM